MGTSGTGSGSSRLRRLTGVAARGAAVAGATVATSTVLVGRDLRNGARRAEEKEPRHPGPYSDEERERAVRDYLTALTRPAGAFRVPFAEDVVRYENGIRTGFGRTHLQWDLFLHLQYSLVKTIEDLEITVDPEGTDEVVRAEFRIVTPVRFAVRVSEDFHVPVADGLIHRIDARVSRDSD